MKYFLIFVESIKILIIIYLKYEKRNTFIKYDFLTKANYFLKKFKIHAKFILFLYIEYTVYFNVLSISLL